MMQKIQRFGGAMFTPVLLFAFSGIVIGFCTIAQNELILGSIAQPDTMWYQCWYVIKEAAWTVFRQVPLLFVVGIPIGLAKKQQGRACMEALVLYITFNYALAAMLQNWGTNFGVDYTLNAGGGTGLALIASIKTLDTGMIGSLVVAGIVVAIHNKYFDTELPEWLGTFRGSSLVCVIGFFAMIATAFAFLVIWPQVQNMISSMQTFFIESSYLGIWVYTFLERFLIPTGLHHFVYMPFTIDSAVVAGGITAAWAQELPTIARSTGSLAELFPAGGFALYGLSKMFAPLGIAGAFYVTAKDHKKQAVIGLMVPVVLTAILCGITEPIEFTFLFVAPILFLIHSILAATLATVAFMLGISGSMGAGLIQNASMNYIPLMGSHGFQYLELLILGLVFTVIWFIVFRFMILKMNLATPGREEDNEETKLVSKAEYKASKSTDSPNLQKAKAFLEALGGKENIIDVTNCATRLRVTLKDESMVKSLAEFKKHGAHGLVTKGKAIQVIVGLSVPQVREEFEKLL